MKQYKKTHLSALLSLLLLSAPVCDDSINDTMNSENDFNVYPYTVHEQSPERTVYFKVSDTGQNTVVALGDDASYPKNPYEISIVAYDNVNLQNHDIVRDNVSNLIWTKCTALDNSSMDTDDNCTGTHGIFTWDEAKTFCETLVYADKNDWRLPTASELFSIINFEHLAPAVDPAIFPNTEGSSGQIGKYWTVTRSSLFGEDTRWRANFNSVDGPAEIDPLMFLNLDYPDEFNFVRCVRGPEL